MKADGLQRDVRRAPQCVIIENIYEAKSESVQISREGDTKDPRSGGLLACPMFDSLSGVKKPSNLPSFVLAANRKRSA